ncbi:hypothetical protein Ciccas_003938 [Cichlidogyrus casuarinus]|uniref:ShKT domain-containing protein n=1 Tax=Cichlidogyrus casuarinus TaxID=1844966 RepID=A0ABD2QD31_9PLAT
MLKVKISYKHDGEKCVKTQQHYKEPCCTKPPKVNRLCDKETGNILTETITDKLVEVGGKKAIDKTLDIKVTPVNCEPPKPITGRCGESKKNMQKVVSFVANKDFDKCVCQKPKRIEEFKTCACPPKQITKAKCIDDKFVETGFVKYALVEGDCKRQVLTKRTLVKCKKSELRTTACKSCNFNTQRIYWVPKGCKCIKKVENVGKQKHCCCKNKRVIRKCLKNNLCVCRNASQKIKGKCVKCEQKVTEKIQIVENCKCVTKNETITKQKCCCPEPTREVRCIDGKQILIDKTHELHKGKCFPKVKIAETEPICPPQSFIRGQCNWKTMTQTLRRIYYVADKSTCKCNQREKITTIKCQCDLPMVFKDDTNAQPGKRNVVLRVFTPGDGTTSGVPSAENLGLKPGGEPEQPGTTPAPQLPTSIEVQLKPTFVALSKDDKKLLDLKPNEDIPLKLTPEQRQQLGKKPEDKVYALTPEEKKKIGLKPYEALPLDLTPKQEATLKQAGVEPGKELPPLTPEQITKTIREALDLKPEEKLPLDLTETQKKTLGLDPKSAVTQLTPEQKKKLGLITEDKIPVKLTPEQKEKIAHLVLAKALKPDTPIALVPLPGRLTPEQKKKIGLDEDEPLPLLLTPEQRKTLGIKPGIPVFELKPEELKKIGKIAQAQLPLNLTPEQKKEIGLKPDENLAPAAAQLIPPTKPGEEPRLVAVKLVLEKKPEEKHEEIVQLPGRLSPQQKVTIGVKLDEKLPLKLSKEEREILKLKKNEPVYDLTQEQLFKIKKTSILELPIALTPEQKLKLNLPANEDLPTTTFRKLPSNKKEPAQYLPIEGTLPADGQVPKELQELRKLCNRHIDTILHTEDKECKEPKTEKKCLKDGKTVQYIETKFQLRSVLVEGVEHQKCLPEVTRENVPAELTKGCNVIKHRHSSGCVNNKRCEYDVTTEVKDCKCRKVTKKVGCFGCNCEEKSNYDEQCVGPKKHVTVNNYKSAAGQCALTKTETKHEIQCPQMPSSAGICNIKENNAILRIINIPQPTVVDCKCMSKAREIKKFCACQDPKYLFKCDLKSQNRIHLTVEYIRDGLKCEPKVIRTINNPECPPKRFTQEGECDRETCLQTITLKERTFKDCKCDFVEQKKLVPCCCRKNTPAVSGTKTPFKPGQYCRNGTQVTTMERLELKRREYKVFPTSPDSPKMPYCALETITSERNVTCKQPEITHSCDKRLNRWTYTETSYYSQVKKPRMIYLQLHRARECAKGNAWCMDDATNKQAFHYFYSSRVKNCKCKSKTKVEYREGCAEPPRPGVICPESNSTITKCLSGTAYRIQNINVLLKGECKTIQKKFELQCKCAKPIIKEECNNGKHVQTVFKETLNSDFKCQKVSHKKVADMGCSQTEDKKFQVLSKSQCDKDGKRNVTLGRGVWDMFGCTCKQQLKHTVENCRCKACEPVTKKCLDGKVEKITLKCERLEKGTCIPYEKIVNEPVICKNDGPQESKTICDEKTGKQNVTLAETKSIGCKCTPVNITKQVFCNCHKDEKFKPKKTLKCVGDDILEMSHVQYVPDKDKALACIPKIYSKSSRISCDGTPKTEVTVCKNCKQNIIIYNQIANKCKCKTNVLEKREVTCCCPFEQKILSTECKENTVYSVIQNTRLIAGKCEPVKSVEKREIECAERPILTRKCGPETDCKGTEQLIIHKPENCKCVPKVVRNANIECCCKKKFEISRFCDATTGSRVTVIKQMVLLKDKCQMVQKTVAKPPKGCEDGRNCMLEISPTCINGRKLVFEKCLAPNKATCKCDATFRKIADVPCNCVPVERIEKSDCVGNNREMKVFTKKMVGGICSDVLVGKQIVPCKCEDTIRENCIEDRFMEKIYTYSSFNDKESNCINRTKVVKTPIPECHPSKKDLEPKELPCEGDQQIVIEKVPRTIPCKCKKNLKTETRCVKNTDKITITTKNVIEKGKCVEKRSEHTIKLEGCVAKREVFGPCSPDQDGSGRSSRQVFEERFFYKNCECTTEKKPLRMEKCSCKHRVEEEICIDKKLNHTRIEEKLVNGKCLKIKVSKQEDMGKKCSELNKDEKTKPSPEDGTYKIITTRADASNSCDCITKQTAVLCDKECKPIPKQLKCTGDFLLKATQQKVVQDGCRCKVEQIESFERPKCLPIKEKLKVSECKADKSGDSYQEHVMAKHEEDEKNCACRIVYDRKKILCAVPPKTKTNKECKNDVIKVTEVLQDIVNPISGTKERVVKNKEEKTINCEKPKYVNKCTKDSGPGVLETVSFEPKGCECIQKKKSHAVDCACNPIKKLVGYGECDKVTCTKKVRYVSKSRTVDGECIEFPITRTEKCCCPSPLREVKCDAEKGLVVEVETTYKLRNGECVSDVKRSKNPIKCAPKVEVKSQCSTNGIATLTTYENKHRGCSCQMMPVETKIGNCKCAPPKTTVKCDQKGSRKIITTISENLKNMICLKEEIVTYQPVKCNKVVTETPEKCNKQKGTKKTIVETTELTEDCECKTKTRSIETLCDCGKPEAPKENCDPKTGVIESVSFDVLKNNGHCKSAKKVNSRTLICLPLVWTPVPSDTCDHRILEKGYRDGCQCKVKREKQPCDCECLPKKPTYKCASNGNFMIKRTYEVHKEQCKCVYTHYELPIPVYCPVNVETFGKCDTKTCIQHKNTHFHEVVQCKCVKKTKSTPQACCCRAGEIKLSCEKSFGLKQVTQQTPILMDGKCLSHERRVETKIDCDKLNAKLGGCVASGICSSKGTQEHTCLTYEPCKPSKRTEGVCNPVTCKKEIELSNFYQSGDKCIEEKSIKSYDCCCTERGNQTDSCEANKLISRASYFTFDKTKGTCVKHMTTKDVTPTCDTTYTNKGPCEKCKQAIYTTVFERINCECKKRTFVSGYAKCCCSDKMELKEKCLDKKSEVTTKREILKGDQCHPLKTTTTSRIICPKDEIFNSPCDLKLCQQALKVVSYKLKGCLCQMHVELYHSKCCSNKDGYAYHICDKKTGEIIELAVQYRIDPKGGVINKVVEKDKTQVQCPTNEEKEEGLCEIKDAANPKLRFKLIKTVVNMRVGCKCEKSVKHDKELCSCGPPKETKICTKDGEEQIIQKTPKLIQVQGKSICKEEEKVLSKNTIQCNQAPIVEKAECNDLTGKRQITTIRMVREGCKCVPKESVMLVTCSCSKPTSEEICKHNYKEIMSSFDEMKCTGEGKEKTCKCEMNTKLRREKVDCPDFQHYTTPCLENGFKEAHVTRYEVKDCKCVAKELPVKKIPCNKCMDVLDKQFCEKAKSQAKCSEMKIAQACQSTCGFCLKENCRKVPMAQLKLVKESHMRLAPDEMKDGRLNLIKIVALKSEEDCVEQCKKLNTCLSVDVLTKMKRCKLYNVNAETLARIPQFKGPKYTKNGLHVSFKCVKKCPEPKVETVGKCVCSNTEIGRVCKMNVTELENKPTKDLEAQCLVKPIQKEVLCGCVNTKPLQTCEKLKAQGGCKDKDIMKACAKSCDPKCKTCEGSIDLWNCKKNANGIITLHKETTKQMREKNACTVKTISTDTGGLCVKADCPGKDIVVSDCIQGKRTTVVTSFVKDDEHNCKPKRSTTTDSCQSCCPSVEYSVRPCVDGSRQVLMIYWTNKNNCCVQETKAISYECNSKCLNDSFEKSTCVNGKQLVHHSFYVGNACMKKTVTNMVECS